MIVRVCQHEHRKKNGKDKNGSQRYLCKDCGATFYVAKDRPLGCLRTSIDEAAYVLQLLLRGGTSIRAAADITGLDKNTILRIIEVVGDKCEAFLENEICDLGVGDVTIDEVWSFVGCKQATADRQQKSAEFGDAYCFIATERESRLVLCWHLDKRDSNGTGVFCDQLSRATDGRYQVSTDGFGPYQLHIPRALKYNVDFAQVVKVYGTEPEGENRSERKYSPNRLSRCDKHVIFGDPDLGRTTTSHSERLNLTVRTHLRRWTRLTNGFSKTWENHQRMLAIFFCWYNWCRKHETLKRTPAQAACLTDYQLTIRELIRKVAQQ